MSVSKAMTAMKAEAATEDVKGKAVNAMTAMSAIEVVKGKATKAMRARATTAVVKDKALKLSRPGRDRVSFSSLPLLGPECVIPQG